MKRKSTSNYARPHGCVIEKRAKKNGPGRHLKLYGEAGICQEFNSAFEKVFCARRPWLKQPEAGWTLAPFGRQKATP